MRIAVLDAGAYARVLATRPVYSHAWFRIHALPNALAHPRLGMILAKKITRTGVLRNALKRQIREAFTQANASSLLAGDVLVRLMKRADPPTKAWETKFGQAVVKGLQKAASPLHA